MSTLLIRSAPPEGTDEAALVAVVVTPLLLLLASLESPAMNQINKILICII